MEFNGKNAIVATEDKDDAVAFSIEKTAIPNEFQIAYYKEGDAQSAHYVNIMKTLITSFVSGVEEGPLHIGGVNAAYEVQVTMKTMMSISGKGPPFT